MKKTLLINIVSAILTLIFIVPIFWIGCGVVYLLSKEIGISYEATNTYLFIYLQPIVLVITAFIGVIFTIGKTFTNFNFKRFGFLVGYLMSFFCQILYVYYLYDLFGGMSAHDIGMKTYGILRQWGEVLEMGYIGVNVFVFIFLFLGIMMFNFTPFYLFNKKGVEMSFTQKVYRVIQPFLFIILFALVSVYYEKEIRQGKYFNSKEEMNEFIDNIESDTVSVVNFFITGLLEGDKRQMEKNN